MHAALIAGLLSHIGLREGDTREYPGARNSKFVLAPGSVLTKRPPRWIVVADLVETSRLYGRIAARIEPGVRGTSRRGSGAAHLQRAALGCQARRGDGLRAGDALRAAAGAAPPGRLRRRSTRRWPANCSSGTRSSRATGRPATTSSATTRGCARNWPRSRSGPAAATCWSATTRSTRFYDARIPADVVSARHFDGWWKKQRHQTPDLLTFTRDDLLRTDDAGADQPDTWQAGDLSLPLTYRFEPGAADDGVTVHVPVEVLARLGGDEFAWQVPALREELVTALIRSLPKDLRRNFVPAPDTARAVLAAIEPGAEPLLEALQRELRRRTGVLVPIDAFDLDKLPAHLRVTFAVECADGTEVARGKDLDALQDTTGRRRSAHAVAEAVAGELERTGLRAWPDDLDELPRSVERTSGGHTVRGYPGVGRRRRRRRRAGVRDGGRTGRGDGAGHPPAAAAGGAVAGESR